MSANVETVYFSDRRFQVTSSRVVTPGETFALGGIVSVSVLEQSAWSVLNVVGVVGVVLSCLAMLPATFAGIHAAASVHPVLLGVAAVPLAALALSAFLCRFRRPTHALILNTSAGQRATIPTADAESAERLAKAVEQALADLG